MRFSASALMGGTWRRAIASRASCRSKARLRFRRVVDPRLGGAPAVIGHESDTRVTSLPPCRAEVAVPIDDALENSYDVRQAAKRVAASPASTATIPIAQGADGRAGKADHLPPGARPEAIRATPDRSR